MKEARWTLSEACRHTSISQSLGSKLIAILENLAPDLISKLDEGWDVERAYLVSQEPDHAKQRQLAMQSGLSRDQLRQRAKGNGASRVSDGAGASPARFALPGGIAISIQGASLSAGLAIEVLQETIKQLRKGVAQGLSLSSIMKCMSDTARPAKPNPT